MPIQSPQGGANVRFPPPLVLLGLIGLGVLLQLWVRPIVLPFGGWPRIAGGTLLAISGFALVLAARLWFRRTGQDPRPWRPSPELLVRGIYRHTRNPMYVGMTLLQVGLGVALGNPWIGILAPMTLLLIHFIAVRPEEDYLSDKFGDSYARYKATVRRYL